MGQVTKRGLVDSEVSSLHEAGTDAPNWDNPESFTDRSKGPALLVAAANFEHLVRWWLLTGQSHATLPQPLCDPLTVYALIDRDQL